MSFISKTFHCDSGIALKIINAQCSQEDTHSRAQLRTHTHSENTHKYKQVPCSKAFQQTRVHGLTIKSPCCARICSNMLWIPSPDCANPPQSTIRPQGYRDVACWFIKFSLKWSLSSVSDSQGSGAARFPQFWRATLMICNPLSDWPKALIRISIPEAPGVGGGAPAYSHSQLARIQPLDLIKESTCVWLPPAPQREELLKSMPTPLL